MSKIKIIFVAPHLSTGGMPQYLLKTIESLENFEIYVVEYSNFSPHYIVQKEKIKKIIGDSHFFSLNNEKRELYKILDRIRPDILHLQEIPELFMDFQITKEIYEARRSFLIYETTHSSDFNVSNKIFFPDKFVFVCPFSEIQYARFGIPSEIIEYPIDKHIENKQSSLIQLDLDIDVKHVVIIGLFTPRKNQSYIFQLARLLIDYPIQFHFLGNQAPNFASYWQPLMDNKPKNCIIWGERADITTFLEIADLSLFPSKGRIGDKELNPLTIKESLSYNIPTMINDLDVYLNRFDNNSLIKFFTEAPEKDKNTILEILNFIRKKESIFQIEFKDNENKIFIASDSIKDNVSCYVRDLDSNLPLYKTTLDFAKLDSWYVIPIPISIFDPREIKTFAGYSLEFFVDDKLIESQRLVYRNIFHAPPQKIYADKNDSPFFNYYEFFHNDIYNQIDFSPFETIVDIGSNIGLFSIYAHQKGVKKILSVEPGAKAFEALKLNTFPGLIVENCAISTSDGSLVLYEAEENSTITAYKERNWVGEFGNITKITVPSLTIKSLILKHNIDKVDLLKMDIEGLEYSVLESLDETVLDKIENLLVEFHDNNNNKLNLLVKFLQKHHYNLSFFCKKEKIENYSQLSQGWFFANKSKVPAIKSNKNTLPNQAVITFADNNYLNIAELLIKSIRQYSEIPIILFTINCDAAYTYTNLTKIPYHTDSKSPSLNKNLTFISSLLDKKIIKPDQNALGFVNRDDPEVLKMLGLKFDIILKCLDSGIENGLFLDADGIVNQNIESIFDHCDKITNYPFATKHIHNYLIYKGKGDPRLGDVLEKPLMDLLNVTDRSCHSVSTNFFLFKHTNKRFFEECRDVMKRTEVINSPQIYAPFQDETVFNVMLWKYKAAEKLPLCFYNVLGFTNFLKFTTYPKTDVFLDTEWQFIPQDKDDVKYFHGCKNIEELEKIISYQSTPHMEMMTNNNSNIAIVLSYDLKISSLAGLSILDKKQYADIHKYDLIVCNKNYLQPPGWSKIPLILKHLKNFEWVFWIDLDTLIMNKSVKLEKFIDTESHLIFCKDPVDLVNTGAFFIKNSDIGFEFLYQLLDSYNNKDYHNFPYEQKSISLTLEEKKYKNVTKILPQNSFNSFWYITDPDTLKFYPDWNRKFTIYQKGDFLVHFVGNKYEERLKLMERFYNENLSS